MAQSADDMTGQVRGLYVLHDFAKWARKGMFPAEFGMLVAIVGTLPIGSVIGGTMGLRIPMTAVPQRTTLSHSLGALAATLVGVSEYIRHQHHLSAVAMTPLGFEVVIGGLTFAGSSCVASQIRQVLISLTVLSGPAPSAHAEALGKQPRTPTIRAKRTNTKWIAA